MLSLSLHPFAKTQYGGDSYFITFEETLGPGTMTSSISSGWDSTPGRRTFHITHKMPGTRTRTAMIQNMPEMSSIGGTL
jgi:hypothetical protein